jgi:hypothetical protein
LLAKKLGRFTYLFLGVFLFEAYFKNGKVYSIRTYNLLWNTLGLELAKREKFSVVKQNDPREGSLSNQVPTVSV